LRRRARADFFAECRRQRSKSARRTLVQMAQSHPLRFPRLSRIVTVTRTNAHERGPNQGPRRLAPAVLEAQLLNWSRERPAITKAPQRPSYDSWPNTRRLHRRARADERQRPKLRAPSLAIDLAWQARPRRARRPARISRRSRARREPCRLRRRGRWLRPDTPGCSGSRSPRFSSSGPLRWACKRRRCRPRFRHNLALCGSSRFRARIGRAGRGKTRPCSRR
jgi:hypothetical protein